MEILYKNNLQISDKSNLFIALCKSCENKYCIFTFETSKLSCVGFFAKSNAERLLTEENPNLIFVDREKLERQLDTCLLAHSEPLKTEYRNIQNLLTNEVKNAR